MRYLYLHGFASGRLSKKGVHMRRVFEACGVTLELLELNVPSFERLSVRAMIAHVESHAGPLTLMGSSLGGWVAARVAERNPERVERAVLLCPAFDLAGRWPDIMPAGVMESWRRDGHTPLEDGAGVVRPLWYGFFEECLEEPPWPAVPCPTLIVHGTEDSRVPVDGSRRYARERDHVRLVETRDGHDLLASLGIIEDETLRFLGLRHPAPV